MRRKMTLTSAGRVLAIVVIVIVSAVIINAQSGRRSKTKPSAPEPVPTPHETLAKPQPTPHLQLLVAVNELTGLERVHPRFSGIVLDTCVRRLREAAGVSATAAPRRMTRGEAIKAAKSETTRYVVWLEVRNERDDYGVDVSAQSDWLYVNYTILEPETAKIKETGRAQAGTARDGDVGVSGRLPRGVYSDHLIKEAARQAADRILEAFKIRDGNWPR